MNMLHETACGECHHLWRALADAADAYVKIIRDHKAIPARVRPTGPPIELKAAGIRRQQARKALRAHDSMHSKT